MMDDEATIRGVIAGFFLLGLGLGMAVSVPTLAILQAVLA